MEAFANMTPEQIQTITENRNMAAQAQFRPGTQTARKKRLVRRQQILDLNTKLRAATLGLVNWREDYSRMGDEEWDDLLLQYENDMTEAMQMKAENESYALQARPASVPGGGEVPRGGEREATFLDAWNKRKRQASLFG